MQLLRTPGGTQVSIGTTKTKKHATVQVAQCSLPGMLGGVREWEMRRQQKRVQCPAFASIQRNISATGQC